MSTTSPPRRLLAALATMVFTVIFGIAAQQLPAQAATETNTGQTAVNSSVILSDSCNYGGRACFYRDSSYSTSSLRRIVQIGEDFHPSYTGYQWDSSAQHMNDQLTSLQGHVQGYIVLYQNAYYGGRALTLAAGVWPSSLSAYNFNDITSSHVWLL